MLTLDSLELRLKQWSARLATVLPRTGPAPIAIYQELYALTHELKTSTQLTTDTGVQQLSPLVANVDALLRPLAHDELELSAVASASIARIAAQPDGLLEALAVFLTTENARATPVSQAAAPVLSRPLSWDALARARATSCTRHGYRFFERDDQLALTALPHFDDRLNGELRPRGGLVIARKLDAIPPVAGATELTVKIQTLCALPSGVEAAEGWSMVRQDR